MNRKYHVWGHVIRCNIYVDLVTPNYVQFRCRLVILLTRTRVNPCGMNISNSGGAAWNVFRRNRLTESLPREQLVHQPYRSRSLGANYRTKSGHLANWLYGLFEVLPLGVDFRTSRWRLAIQPSMWPNLAGHLANVMKFTGETFNDETREAR